MTVIKGEWAEPCPDCGAPKSCCATAKARWEEANRLAGVVRKQASEIKTLTRELADERKILSTLRMRPNSL